MGGTAGWIQAIGSSSTILIRLPRAQLPAERGYERPAVDLRGTMGANQNRVALGRVEREGADEARVPQQLDALHRVAPHPEPVAFVAQRVAGRNDAPGVQRVRSSSPPESTIRSDQSARTKRVRSGAVVTRPPPAQSIVGEIVVQSSSPV